MTDRETMLAQSEMTRLNREAKVARLRQLAADGLTVPEIAERMGLLADGVRRSLKALGLKVAPVNDGLSRLREGKSPGLSVWTNRKRRAG